MRRVEYLAPASLVEAVTLLAEDPARRLLAGGTDLIGQIKERGLRPSAVISLRRLDQLAGITATADGGLRIGATALLADIAEHPDVRRYYAAVAEGAAYIGSLQTKNMATLGGNCCNAAPSADGAPGLLVHEAVATVAAPDGHGGVRLRDLPIEELFLGPGKTALAPGELLVAFTLPPPPARPSGSAYARHTPRKEMDIAVAGAAVRIDLDTAGRVAEARVALSAVAPRPIRARSAEALLRGTTLDEAAAGRAAAAAAEDSSPIDDQRGSATFRRELVRVLTARMIRRAAARARNEETVA